MSTRRHRSRAARPEPEGLETRQLLARSFTGVDLDGDAWVLKLVGPGDLRVVQQPLAGATTVAPVGSPGLIDSITVVGTDPTKSRLIGTVTKGANGDGKVFFQTLDHIGGVGEGVSSNLGIYAIDMPNFWLGQTSSTTPSAANAPRISIPDGIVTLRFGGADTTFAPPGGTAPSENTQNDTFNISLGLPRTWGTSIVVDQVISSASANSSSTAANPTPLQDSVVFSVFGRLNTFQANEIIGNADFPPTGFATGGGTVVQSLPVSNAGITGQIGFVRVGGNATNFSVQTNDKVSNFYIGGETNQVSLLSPNGSRNILFGKGMDKVNIQTHYIETLQANRGAVGSNVTVDRDIERLTLGGDVVNTAILSGYQQGLASVFSNQQQNALPPQADPGGAINSVLIAGDVVNSIFAASAEPYLGQYDVPETLLFPHSHINGKISGTIQNDVAAPSMPGQAFFAKEVKVTQGPVIPPFVPELPFPHPNAPPSGPRVVNSLQPVNRPGAHAHRHAEASGTTTPGDGTAAASRSSAIPQGPAARTRRA